MTDFAAYCFYVNRPGLIRRAIDAFPDLWPELTVVDNSDKANYLAAVDIDPAAVFIPPVPLTYAQSMNWMLKDALSRGKKLILHFHSDAATTNPNAVSELLAYARRDLAEGKRRACWWTFYDILWAINVEAFLDIGGCDPLFPSYFTDQDLKRRWHLRGWETIDTHIQGMSHEGSATINSDPKLQCENGRTFKWQATLYFEKWGGEPGHEVYIAPWNRPDLFGDMKPYGGVS